ncbi:MAG: alcohol dehydrogenase catalytic domain-containing protein [Anaerolineae bacterium]|nr:alcohol dehydrogenase catalytic domain-containing protein [Anaerolineae bacterium]
MKGVVVIGNRQVQVRELPKPEAEHGQVVVRAVEVGVCGSDLHGYRAQAREGARRLVSGHELTGVVESVGPGVEHLKPGDRVVAYQAWGCGYCEFCASGRSNLCVNRKIIGKKDRYQKEYSVMPEAVALPLPDWMTFDDGVTLSCAGGTAWGGLQRVKPSCDDALVVFGLGPVGLMGAMWARAMGAYVIGVEVVPERLELGLASGCNAVIDPSNEDVVERVMELTYGYGASVGYEASGNKEAQRLMLEATHYAARLVYVAIGGPGEVIDPRTARNRGPYLGLRAIHGTFTFSMGDWYDMLRAIRLQGLQPGKIVTHRFSIDQASEAYAMADSGRCGKVIFQWNG